MADTMVFMKTALTGGGAGALDLIDGTDRGDGDPLQEGDTAFVSVGGVLYFYYLDEDSAAAESSPTVIRPDTNAGDKRWIQQSIPAAGYVAESLFDAYSILYADSDNTPARLTVGTSTIVGRKAADGIVALSASEVRTIINVADGATANNMAAPGAIGGTTPNTIQGYNKEIFKTASADSPLTAAECSGTIVSNYGMTDADCIVDLPIAAEGLSFVCVLPAVRARYFRLRCPSAQADKIYLLGVAGSDDGYVGVASGYATGSAISMFTFKASDGGYDWFAIPIFGTWVAG